MVRAREQAFDRTIWPEFAKIHKEPVSYFEDVADDLITRAMGSDGDDSALEQPQLPG